MRKMMHQFRSPPQGFDIRKWSGVMIYGTITKSLAGFLAPRDLMGAVGMGRCNWGDSIMFMTAYDYNLLGIRIHEEADRSTRFDFYALSVIGFRNRFRVFNWTQVQDPHEKDSTMWKQERIDRERRDRIKKEREKRS